MTVLEPHPEDDIRALAPMVRQHNAGKLQALIRHLEPQVDGSYGPVNPRLYEVYMRALKELGLLYRVYDPPPPPKDDDGRVEEARAEALRAQVEKQLTEIASRAAGDEPQRP